MFKKTSILFTFFLGAFFLSANVFLEKAFAEHEKREFASAEKNYQKAIAEGANETIVRYNLANLYYQTDRLALAIANYQNVITRAPEFKNAYHNLGKIFFNSEEYVLALETFMGYFKVNATDWDTLVLIGDTFKKLNIFSKAYTFYEKALTLEKENENSYIILAEFYLDLLDKKKAYYYLDLAIENQVNTLAINELKANLLEEDQEYFRAIYLYQNLLQSRKNLSEDETYRLEAKIIENFLKAGTTQLAINNLQNIIKKYGKKSDMFRLEDVYQKQKKTKEAFTFFSSIYEKNKTKVYPIVKNLLILAYNNEEKELINDIISFYKQNQIKDEILTLIENETT